MPEDNIDHINFEDLNQNALSEPLVRHIYTADPSAHYFNGKIYIYPSHDVDAGEAFDDLGSHFAMEDYHVISMDSIDSEAVGQWGCTSCKRCSVGKTTNVGPRRQRKKRNLLFIFPCQRF
jgi:hypothetical protein